MKFNAAILAALADGRQRSTAEMYPYLSKRIEPRAAVKCYLSRHRQAVKSGKPLAPLDKQIEEGNWVTIYAALTNQEQSGNVIIERPEGYTEGLMVKHLKVQLTPAALELLWLPPKERGKRRKSNPIDKARLGKQTEIWNEIIYARSRGWLGVQMELDVTAEMDTASIGADAEVTEPVTSDEEVSV